jgi:hypothetical protein
MSLISQKDRNLDNHYPAKVGDVCVSELPTGGVIVGTVLSVRDGIVIKIRSNDGVYFVDDRQKLVEPIENFNSKIIDQMYGKYPSLGAAQE